MFMGGLDNAALPDIIALPMDWNDAAEDLLDQILMTTPLPVREQIASRIRAMAEDAAESEGKSRVNTNTVVEAWIQSTPEALRTELPRQMERLGLDPHEFELQLGDI
jgi:hypothetical protein